MPTDQHGLIEAAGARSRHPECSAVRNLSLVPSKLSLKLLQLHLLVGSCSRIRHPLPTLHLLPHYGHRSFQSIPPVMVPSPLSPLRQSRLRIVDASDRNRLHVHVLVSVWILPSMAEHTNLAASHHVCAGLSHHHHASARADHPFPLVNVDERSRRRGKFPAASTPDDYGRQLSGMVGFHTWRITVPGRASSLPWRATP